MLIHDKLLLVEYKVEQKSGTEDLDSCLDSQQQHIFLSFVFKWG